MTKEYKVDQEKIKELAVELERIRNTLKEYENIPPFDQVDKVVDLIRTFADFYDTWSIVKSLQMAEFYKSEITNDGKRRKIIIFQGPCGIDVEVELTDNRYIDVYDLRDKIIHDIIANPKLWNCIANAIERLTKEVYDKVKELEIKLNDLIKTKQ